MTGSRTSLPGTVGVTDPAVVAWLGRWRAAHPDLAAALVAVEPPPLDPLASSPAERLARERAVVEVAAAREAARRRLTSDAVDAGGVAETWTALWDAAARGPSISQRA